MKDHRDNNLDVAADWLVGEVSRPLTSEQRLELGKWLSDPENQQSYDSVRDTWDLMDELVDSSELDELRSAKPEIARPIEVAKPFWPWAIAATILLAVGLASIMVPQMGAISYTTQLGEIRMVELQDGTVVHLDTDTRIDVVFNDDSRHILLSNGRALFDVARDVNRPFRVSVGEVQVTALGTIFDVYRRNYGTEVAVVEGRVNVRRAIIDPAFQSNAASSRDLVRGELASVRGNLDTIDVQPVDIQSVLVWTTGKIELDLTPLPDAIAEFNRYSKHKMRLADAELANIRVSGLFDHSETEAFRASLAQSAPVVTFRTADGTIVISAKPESD